MDEDFIILRYMKVIAFALIAVAGVVTFLLFANQGSAVQLFQSETWESEVLFMRFVAEHQKTYSNKAEYNDRLAIFNKNLIKMA